MYNQFAMLTIFQIPRQESKDTHRGAKVFVCLQRGQ